MPSASRRSASVPYARPAWFTRKPGVSRARTGAWPKACARRIRRSITAGSVRTPSITSTTFMSGTGLKKCKPATRPGCWHAAAIAVTESEEVLVARMQSAATVCSRARKSSRLASRSSTTASTTMLQRARSARLATGCSRAMQRAASAATSLPFSAMRCSCVAMPSFAASAVPARAS